MNNYYAPFQRPIQPVNGYYNPSFPIGQDMQYQQQPAAQQPFIPQNQPSGDMIWVLNETEAMSYPVAPNSSVILWDKNDDTVYLKSANMQGVPSIRILDYVERTAENAPKTPVNANSGRGAVFSARMLSTRYEANLTRYGAMWTQSKGKQASKRP